jgi:intracellular septation protein A
MSEQHNPPSSQTESEAPEKQPSLLWNLVFNLVMPALILSKLSGNEFLGIKMAIVVALAFPIAYGVKDFTRAGKINFFSGLGVVSVSLTGGISLLELDAIYIAIKEASIPAVLGVATVLSLKTSQPLIHTFLLNKSVVNIKKITNALLEKNSRPAFDKLLVNASWILAGSFFLSALLNFILAVVLLTAEPGSVAFNQQLGKMTALSFPVISLPLMVVLTADLFYIFRGIKRLTGMPLEEILNVDTEKK